MKFLQVIYYLLEKKAVTISSKIGFVQSNRNWHKFKCIYQKKPQAFFRIFRKSLTLKHPPDSDFSSTTAFFWSWS